MEALLISSLAWILIVVGLIGVVAPVLPGIGLIFSGIFLYAWYFGFGEIGITTLVVLGIIALLSMAVDYLASAYGAARFGSSKWGIAGSVVGGLFGFLILSLPGLLLGLFFGAVAGELFFAKKDTEASFRAGWGSVLGFLGGTVLKLILAIAMIITFMIRIWS